MERNDKYAKYEGIVDIEELAPEDEGYWKMSLEIFKKNRAGMIAALVLICMVLLSLFGEYMRPFGIQEQNTAIRNQSPSLEHWFGTDQLGRDIFVRVCHGGQVSIEIALLAAVIVSVIGVIYGSLSGYMGGKVDITMMRIIEIVKGVPHLVIVILLSVLLNVNGIFPLLLAMTISGWTGIAQVIRGQVKQLKNQEFIMAAQCLGVSTRTILLRHIVPNMMGMIIVAMTLEIPTFIFEESFLSFIGLGLKHPAVSWGILISLAQPNLLHYPYQVAFPAVAISIIMIAFNVFGNAWKDAFDPKIR